MLQFQVAIIAYSLYYKFYRLSIQEHFGSGLSSKMEKLQEVGRGSEDKLYPQGIWAELQ